MRKRMYLILTVLFISSAIAGCEKPQQPDGSNSASEIVATLQLPLAGYDLPLTVGHVVTDLGLPGSTFIDDNELCPIGQLHSWDFKNDNYVLLVLGDSYSEKASYRAGSRLFGVKKGNQKRPSKFEGFLEIRMDDPEAEVKRKLKSFVARNPGYSISHNDRGSPVHRFFCPYKQYKLQYILESGGAYIYFIINKTGRLVAVIKASFNVLNAC